MGGVRYKVGKCTARLIDYLSMEKMLVLYVGSGKNV